MMSGDLKDAMRDWDREVDAEATRLIKCGVPPWDAVEQARRNVSERRSGRNKFGIRGRMPLNDTDR